MQIVKNIQGTRPLLSLQEKVLVARGRTLYLCDTEFTTYHVLGTIPSSPLKNLLSTFRIMRRILRLEPTVAVAADDNTVLVLCGNAIWSVNLATGHIACDFAIPEGKKALTFTKVVGIEGIEDGFYFGDYWDNKNKDPVHIWFRPLHATQWKNIYTLPAGEIEHIHDIVPDPYRQCLWILSGDFGSGAGLWRVTENFKNVDAVLRGSQQYRAAWLYPLKDMLVYATDTQFDQNYLYCLHQRGGVWGIEPISAIEGSSIYASKGEERIYFSTTVEPGEVTGNLWRDLFEQKRGPGILDSNAYVYSYTPQEGVKKILHSRKDFYPMRLAQFGTFHFCRVTEKPDKHIYVYGCAVDNYDGHLLHIILEPVAI